MAGVGSLWVELRARTAQFAAEMKTASEAIEGVKASLSEVAKAAGLASAAMAGVGALAVKAASDFEQTGSLVDRVFGAAASEVKAFARVTSDELGVSIMEVTQGLTSIGAQLKNTLGDPTAAKEQAEAMVKLAADISAAMNIPFAETLERLQSGLRGETEAIEKLNIFIGESSLKQEALRLGIGKSVEKMNEQEKTALRLAAIMRQTKDLTGAAAGEAGTFAGQTARLEAGIKNLAIELGQALLPAATSLVSALNGAIRWVRELDPAVKTLAARVAAVTAVLLALVAVLAAAGAAFLAAAGGAVALGSALSAPAGAAFVAALGPVLSTVLAIVAAVAALVLLIGALKYAWDRAGTDTKDTLKDLAENIGQTFGGVISSIVDFAEKAISIPVKLLGLFAKQLALFLKSHAQLFKMIGLDSIADGLGNAAFDVEGFADTAMGFQVDLVESFKFGAFVLQETAKDVGKIVGDGIKGSLEGLASFVDGVTGKVKEAAGVSPNGKPKDLDLPGDGEKKDKSPRFLNLKLGADMERGFDKLHDMITDAVAAGEAWAQTLESVAPDVTDAGNKLAKQFEEAAKAAKETQTSGDTLGMVFDHLREGAIAELAMATQQAIAANGSAAAFTELRKQAERLGIQFEDVVDDMKQLDFDRTASDQGPGVAGAVARGIFGQIRDAFGGEGQGSAKALAEHIGGVASSALSGGLDVSSIGSVIGAALGSVAPGVGTAIGASVGGAVAQALQTVVQAFSTAAAGIATVVAGFLQSDPRLAKATQAAADAAGPLLLLAGAAAAVTGVLVVLGPMFGVLAVQLGALAAVAGFAGAWVAVITALATLTLETQGAQKAMAVIGLVVDRVVAMLEPLGQHLMSVAGLFSLFVDVLAPFIKAFGESRAVAEVLFYVLKALALAFGQLVIWLVEISKLLGVDLGVNVKSMKAALKELEKATLDSAEAIARNESGKAALEAAKAAKEEARRRAEEAAAAGSETSNPLQQLTEGIFNAVADFKVEAYRFKAMDAVPAFNGAQGPRNILDELGQLKNPPAVVIENLALMAADPRDFFDKLENVAEQKQFEQTGTKAKGGRSRPYGR